MTTPSSFTSEQDFAEAYDRYAEVIFRHCYLRVLDRETAKQLMQETFRRLWQFIADGNYVDAMQLFLYRSAHVVIEEHTRSIFSFASPDPGEEGDAVEAALLSLLQQVPAKERCVLILHYVDGFSLKEIGRILGGSVREHALALRGGKSCLSSLLSHGR